MVGSRSTLIYRLLLFCDLCQRQSDILLASEKLDWQFNLKLDKGFVKTIVYFKTLYFKDGVLK
jgi:hypothetical protein